MTAGEMLKRYREVALEIEELERQLERACPTGKPSGGHGAMSGVRGPSTNDPLSAALQLADGLEALIRQKRAVLDELSQPLYHTLTSITDGRVLQIVQGYYLLTQTDEQIGMMLGLSTTRINQIRNQYLRTAS